MKRLMISEDGIFFYPSTTQTATFHYAAFIKEQFIIFRKKYFQPKKLSLLSLHTQYFINRSHVLWCVNFQ